MKYFAIILAAGVSYLFLAHKTVVIPTAKPVPEAAAPGTDFLKSPLDRTQDVLKQARARAADPALQ